MHEQELRGLMEMARARVGRARELLAQPRTCHLDECVTLFREAEGYLEWLRDSLARRTPGHASLRGGAASLAGEVRQAGILLDQGARLGSRWLASGRSGEPLYMPSGGSAPADLSGHVAFFG